MSNSNFLDELFQRPLDLPGNDAMTAHIMREVARVERRRKALLVGSGLAGTGIAVGIVLWANVLPAISVGVLPALESCFGTVGTMIGRFMAGEPLLGGFAVWALTAASLVAMGVAAGRVGREV
jgi:small basic protein